MAFIQCNMYSHILGREVAVNIILPHASKQFDIGADLGKIPVLYLLHGLSENHSVWSRKSSIERYVTGKRLAVVMPDGGRDFYTDTKSGIKWFGYLTEELPKAICSMTNISDKREDNFIAGLSMGGYGALKAAFVRSDLFSCAASLSGAVDIGRVLDMSGETPEISAVFGDDGEYACDLYQALADCKNVPSVYQCCGTKDFLYADNQAFRDFAMKYVTDFTYDEDEYDHCWDFWDMEIKKVIDWLCKRNDKI